MEDSWFRPVARIVVLAMAVALVSLIPIAARGQEQPSQPAKSGTAEKPDRKKARTAPRGEKPAGKTGTSARSAADSPPTVMSKAAADAKRPRSPFLMSGGSAGTSVQDRYNLEETDWSDIPAWRQTSFFGVRSRGQFFVFVVDQSGSMLDDDRLIRAKIELLRTVYALQPPQRFEVIFYNEEATPMPGGPRPRAADLKSKSQLSSWLNVIGPDGGTDPRPAIAQALALQPDAVYLLSDGEFPEGTVERVTRLNTHRVPIHCIDMTGGQAGDHLVRIARDNGGHYASRVGTLQAAP